jgi:hypothetical protein
MNATFLLKLVVLISIVFSLKTNVFAQTCAEAEALFLQGKYKNSTEICERNWEQNATDFCSLKLLIKSLEARESYSKIQKQVLSAYEKHRNLPPDVIDVIVACLKWKNRVGLDKKGLSNSECFNIEMIIPKLLKDTNISSTAALNLFYYLKTYGPDTRIRPMTEVNDRRSYDDIRYDEMLKSAFLFCKKADLNDVAALDVFDFICSLLAQQVVFMRFDDVLLNDQKQTPNDSIISSYFAKKGKYFYSKFPDYTKKLITDWDHSVKRDALFFRLIENSAGLSAEELNSMQSEFNRANEKARVLRVMEQRYLRNKQNTQIALEFINLLSEIPDDLYKSASTLFSNTTTEIKKVFNQDIKVLNAYASMLIRHKNYQEAYDLMKDRTDPESKKILFRAKLYVQSPEEAFSYALTEKLPYAFITEKIAVAHKIFSAQNYIKLFFFITEKFPYDIDSLKIMEVGYTGIRGLGTSYSGAFIYAKESDIRKILAIYHKYDYTGYESILEYYYWRVKKPTVEDLNSLLRRKMISPEIVGEILKSYGKKFFDQLSPAEMGHEGIKKGLEYFHMAEKYLKCDQDLLEHIFVSYDLISKRSTADLYGNKLVSCGFSTNGLRAGGGKVRGRGPRGGNYYINGKGNKVYSSD